MTTAIEGALLFSAILVAFGVVSTIGAIVEYLVHKHELRRRRRREVMPEPNPRTVVRRRGWNVPL